MVPAQQLDGVTCHLISQGCRTGDDLGFAFLKTMKEENLLWARQIFAHHESCCSRWKGVHSRWALTINLVRNKQQSFSQLHFSRLLTPCISKGHLKEPQQFRVVTASFEGRERNRACQCIHMQRGGSLPNTSLRNHSVNKDGNVFRRSSIGNKQRSKLL